MVGGQIMTSILKTDKIEGVTASGTVQMPAGMVIQTVQTISRTLVSTSSSTYAEASTAFRCSITPKFSTSKLLITATIGISGFNNSGTD